MEHKTEDRAKKLLFQRMKKQLQNGGSQTSSNDKNALDMSFSNQIDLKVNKIYYFTVIIQKKFKNKIKFSLTKLNLFKMFLLF